MEEKRKTKDKQFLIASIREQHYMKTCGIQHDKTEFHVLKAKSLKQRATAAAAAAATTANEEEAFTTALTFVATKFLHKN